MKRGALEKFFKPAAKKQSPDDSKLESEENATVKTNVTTDIQNVSTINMDIGTISIELFTKKKNHTTSNDLFKINVMNLLFVPTKTVREFNKKKRLKFQCQWFEKWN